MKKLISMTIVIAMALSLASCELTNDFNVHRHEKRAAVSFSWWGNDERSGYTLEALDVYEKKNDVRVNAQYSELSGYKNKMDMDLNADSACDAMQMQYSWMYEYVAKGYEFYDLYKLKDTIRLDNFTEDQLKLGEIDGKLMGIPTSINSINFFYNSNTLKKYGFKEPKTWDELFKLGERLKSDGVYAMEMSEKSLWFSCVAYTEQATGKPMFDHSGRMQYTADDFKVMLEFYKKLIDSNVTPRQNDFNHMDFYNGKAAGIACWISEATSYFNSNTGVDADAVNISLGDPLRISKTTQGGWYKRPMALYCINAGTKDPQRAAQLVDFLVNSEEMAALQGTEKGIPLSKSAQEVLESRDMLSDLQSVASKRMNEDASIGIMNPYLETEALRKAFFSAGDDVAFSNTGAYEKAAELFETVKAIDEIPK